MTYESLYKEFQSGIPVLLGKSVLTETEIIDFAKAFDPLEFHINKEAAEKSIFGSLVASGPQIFQEMHRKFWIPKFADTVLAGLEIKSWKFLNPTYPNKEIECYVTILSRKLNSSGKSVTIHWFYEFKYTATQEMVQCLEMIVLHKP